MSALGQEVDLHIGPFDFVVELDETMLTGPIEARRPRIPPL
jgi:hypothetical protein